MTSAFFMRSYEILKGSDGHCDGNLSKPSLFCSTNSGTRIYGNSNRRVPAPFTDQMASESVFTEAARCIRSGNTEYGIGLPCQLINLSLEFRRQ